MNDELLLIRSLEARVKKLEDAAKSADRELAAFETYVSYRDKQNNMNWPLCRGHLERCVSNARVWLGNDRELL